MSSSAFKQHLIKRIRPPLNSVFNNPIGLKYVTRLRLGLSHLNEHRFNHNFENCLGSKCIYSSENESTLHFFLHSHYYNPIRKCVWRSKNNWCKFIKTPWLQTYRHLIQWIFPFWLKSKLIIINLLYWIYNEFKKI